MRRRQLGQRRTRPTWSGWMVVPELADTCVVLNGVAKTFAMTGWRVGWMAGPVDVIKAAVTVPSVCTTPNNEPSTTSHETEEMAQSSSTQNEGTVRPATAPVDSPPTTEPETSKR